MLAIFFAGTISVWMWASGFTGNYAEAFSGGSAVLVFWAGLSFFLRVGGIRPRRWPDLLFFGIVLVCAVALHQTPVFQSNQEPLWRWSILVPASALMLIAMCYRSYTLARQSS